MRKTLQHAMKVEGQPQKIMRTEVKRILAGTCIIKHRRMYDGTRVLATANGLVFYIQYQTRKQAAHWS